MPLKYKKKRQESGEPTVDNTDIMPISQRADKSNNAFMQTYGLPTCDFSYCRFYRLHRCYSTRMEYIGCPYRQYAKMGDADEILMLYDLHTPHKAKSVGYIGNKKIVYWTCPRCKASHRIVVTNYAEIKYCDRCGQCIERLKLPEQAREDWMEKRKEAGSPLANFDAGKKRKENAENMRRVRETVRDENSSEDVREVQAQHAAEDTPKESRGKEPFTGTT